MKILVIDVDDTLLTSGRLSRLLWSISRCFQNMGRRTQKPNNAVLRQTVGYDKVIVLTGRDSNDCQFTHDQLTRIGLVFDRILCCPRKDLIQQWKLSVIKDLASNNQINWIDNDFEAESTLALLTPPCQNVTVKNTNGSSRKQQPRHPRQLT